ncbi:TfuA-like protein [Paraliomyxa miuraensis]|uniref:TfuA-like protein n=1 Tax=Paraliomyxa miuraensis TaxID=376150 RepID=UPI00225BF222|nr:TfuA-like protein [Paraliomyxa miuraensis]MCX4241319.1 TfuA-like protein [Paraliomyxa miuraensis]
MHGNHATGGCYVFLGPSLPIDQARAVLPHAHFRPPVAQGDVAGLLPLRPEWIGIVDGLFEAVPSVWHKEILLALEQGVRVVGAASMGALRAAELHAFGMEGVGSIFESYRDGRFDGDDEVAIQHGPASTGYRALSEALVNIRATLDAGHDQGLLTARERDELIGAASALPYMRRQWPRLLEHTAAMGLDAATISALRTFVREQPVDQKAADARALLRYIRAQPPAPDPAPGPVARTTFLHDLRYRDAPILGDPTGRARVQDVLDHARLTMPGFESLLDRAASHELAVQLGIRLGLEPSPEDVERARHSLEQRLGWQSPEDGAAWCVDNDLDPDQLEALIERFALVELMKRRFLDRPNEWLLAELKWSDCYAPHARAAASEVHARREAEPPGLDVLVQSHFDRLGQPVPDDLDAWMRRRGIDGRRSLHRLLARAWLASAS